MKKMVFGKGTKLSRRKFIVGSAAAAGGGLARGLNVPFGIGSAQAQGAATEVNIWVAIKPDDICVIRIARSEMGQGTLTGLAQLVAEELECDWKKVTTEGSKVYAIDLKLPGMLNAAIKDCPVFGGKLKSYDESKIAGMPGVKKVVKVKDTAVAVVADTWWRARKALEALPIVWDEGPNASQSSVTIADMLKEGLTATATNGERQHGDALKAIGEATKKVDAVYSTPFLSHATMEVMNCTVKLSADKAEAWVPSQNLEASLAALSEASGVPLAKCEVYRHDLGGGFGRRGGTQDYVHQAVEIAKEFPNVPIKLIWSREEDQAHDFYRPISQCKLSAGLDAD